MIYRKVRLVHPPGWNRATEIRRYLEEDCPGMASAYSCFFKKPREVLGERLQCVARFCHSPTHSPKLWHVWAPVDYSILPYEKGPCDSCNLWKTKTKKNLHFYEISNPHLLSINAFLSKEHQEIINQIKDLHKGSYIGDTRECWPSTRSRSHLLSVLRETQNEWGYILAEMKYRDLIPTLFELSIICDYCSERGLDLENPDLKHWDLSRIWAKYAKTLRNL